MHRTIKTLTSCSLVLAFTLTSCGDGHSTESDDHAEQHSDDDGHDHGADGHEGHDHEGEGHDHGEERALGTVEVHGSTLEVSMSGTAEPNAELHVEIELIEGPRPATVRLWIGGSSGANVLKSKADSEEGHFVAHVEAPAALESDAALWIEVETDSGDRSAQSLPLE